MKIKDIIVKVLPPSERENPVFRLNILKLVLIGLLIRFIFMPFFLHADILTINSGVHFLNYHGVVNIYEYLHRVGDPFAKYTSVARYYWTYPPLPYFLLGAFQFFLRPFTTGLNSFFNSPRGTYELYIFRYLFFMKIPYLVFDLGSAFILLRLFKDRSKSMLAFKFWLFNPIVIFTSYIFGQFDVIPTFFLIVALYYASRKRPYPSALALGIGTCLKNFPLFLLPFLAVIYGKKMIDKVKIFFIGILPYGLSILPFLQGKGYRQAALLNEQNKRFIQAQLGIGGGEFLILFILFYLFIFLHCYYNCDKSENFDSFWKYDTSVFLILFPLTLFHPQWLIWIIPLLAIHYTYDKRALLAHVLLLLFFLPTLTYFPAIPKLLFEPIYPTFFGSLPELSVIIAKFVPPEIFRNIFRSAFAGTCLWLVVDLITSIQRRRIERVLA